MSDTSGVRHRSRTSITNNDGSQVRHRSRPVTISQTNEGVISGDLSRALTTDWVRGTGRVREELRAAENDPVAREFLRNEGRRLGVGDLYEGLRSTADRMFAEACEGAREMGLDFDRDFGGGGGGRWDDR